MKENMTEETQEELSADDNGYYGPSKSQLKREQHAVQEIILEIIALPKEQIANLPASENCQRELQVAARMRPSSSRNRQIRHLAKLVNKEPELLEAFTKLTEKNKANRAESARRLHEMEHWRDQILAGTDEDIFNFVERFGMENQQQLRQLRREYQKLGAMEVSGAKKERAQTKQKELARKLFKLVSQNISQTYKSA